MRVMCLDIEPAFVIRTTKYNEPFESNFPAASCLLPRNFKQIQLVFVCQELRHILIPWLVIFHGASTATDKFSSETLSCLLSEVKAELAKSFFERDLKEKENAKTLNLTHSNVEELRFSNSGENGRMFRSADENFLYNGVDVLHLQKKETPKSRYILNAADDVLLEEGAVFFKNTEWKDKNFLAICYQWGYCEIRMSAPSLNVNLRSRIDTRMLPLDVVFFAAEDDLFLIVVQDPVVMYRWTGTYFNEDSHLDTTGAQSVAAFLDKDKSIITVAQSLGRSKIYSKVYVKKNDHIELLQLLPTNQPLRVLPFELTYEDQVLHFIFVLNNVSPSTIYWWSGKEFLLWNSLKNIFGSRIVYVGKIKSELFFFFSDKNKIYVYHPTVTSFELMQIITFDQEVVGIDLRLEKDEKPLLVLLTGSALDPYFKVNLILLQINYISDSDGGNKSSGGMLRCISNLEKKLADRKAKLDGINGKLTKQKLPESAELSLIPAEEALRETAEKVANLRDRLKTVREDSGAASGRSRRYHVYGDLKIRRMTADRIDVEVLNGESLDFGGLLSLTKDQTLEGDVRVKTLSADVLSVPSVNGVGVEDFLVRNKKVQKVTGEFTLSSLSANEIKFGSSGMLNGIPSSDLLTAENSRDLITGRKIIPKLRAKQLEVDRINDVPSEEWLARILPTLKDQNEEEPLNFTELSIEKLWVSNLNGIPWDDFVDSVYLPLNNEAIKGELRATGRVKIQQLKTNKINGVPIEEMLRRSAHANVTCGKKPQKKPKSLPLSPVWDDTFLKDLLNEPGSKFDEDVKYFTGTQKVGGDVRASHVFLKNPFSLSDVFVEDLENFETRYWMKNQVQVVPVPVDFPKGLSVTHSIHATQINGNSMSSFVWTDRPNFVGGKLVFEDAVITGNVTFAEDIIQNVNVKRLSEDSVNVTGKNVISGRKTFVGSLSTENLHVDFLNGISVSDFMSSVKETLKGSDVVQVPEVIIFGDLEVTDGVRVKRINDADFNETISKALTWDDPELFRKAKFQSLSVKNLDVNTINGLNVEEKLPKLSKTQNKDVYVVIEGNFELPELNATKVNGINFNKFINQVFQVNETETIRGEKIFKEMVTVTGDLRGNLNEYNVTELERVALSKSKPQSVTGVYTVEEFQANDVEADNVDGVPAEEILYRDSLSLQIINSDVVFNDVAVAGDIKVVNFMNDCDLSKVTGVNLENVGDFENLEVMGDLSWEAPREKMEGLSHFLGNVVTKSEDQVITGPVVFENDVVMKDVNGKRHFNDVDLKFISEDAIYQSDRDQEISAPVTFKGDVKANSMEILGNVLIDSINGVDITDLEEKLVRKSADVTVRGKKTFKKGFSANYFAADTVNGAKINEIVFYDDVEEGKEINFPPTTFTKLNVFKDLKVFRVNGYALDEIFDERLSKTAEQVMNGKVVVEGNVTIKGDGNIQRINDVNMEEAILADGEVSAKVITGDIEFRDAISIADKLEVDYINGQNITALLEKALMVDEDAVIEGDVKFDGGVTINGNIDVTDTVNGCDLKKVTGMDFTDRPDETNLQIRESLREEVNELANLTATMSRPVVFMYLKETLQLDLELPTIHGSVANGYNDSVRFNIYGMNYGNCGLPVECYCPTQTNLRIDSLKPESVEVQANSLRFFTFHDEELDVEVNVSTTTVSYSSRCKRRGGEIEEESTSISWKKMGEEVKTYEPKIVKGFLSDVKFFKLGESVYIVTAFYFHPLINETNNLHTVVYELKVRESKIEKVDEIPSSGAQVLETFWTMKGVILVIGNSFDSDRFTDSVNSAIYRFNEYENKFELLRHVKTHGILSIQSMRYKKTSFIFFVQKQSWPLLILKYNQEYDNYYFSQKLETTQSFVRSNFLSVAVISTSTPGYSGDMYVGIVLSDDSFRLFKYKHIEGFVEESYQEQNNVRILHPFWIGTTQYLLAGSGSEISKIYSFVEQGR